MSVDPGTYYTSVDTTGAYLSSIQNPSLAPTVWRASLRDAASGTVPLTALGIYTESGDLLALAQDRFWTHTSDQDRGFGSGSDLFTYAKFDSRSA